MAELQDNLAAPPTPVLKMYRALVGVGTLCGLLIVTVFVLTLPIIEQNQAAFPVSYTHLTLPTITE